jgi:hypothetical protein
MGNRYPSFDDPGHPTRCVLPKEAADCDEASTAARRLDPRVQRIAIFQPHRWPRLHCSEQNSRKSGDIIKAAEQHSHIVERRLGANVALHVNDVF